MRNIESFCPKSISWIEVSDNWYPSFKKRNKSWVKTMVYIHPDDYDVEYIDDGDSRKCIKTHYNYFVVLAFWGADDFALEKAIGVNDFDEAIKVYRQFRKFVRKIKKMNKMDLKYFLYNRHFNPV